MRPTLYEWAGGRVAFCGLIDAFYDRVEHDELIAPLFPGGVSKEHRAHVTLWRVEVFGRLAGLAGLAGVRRRSVCAVSSRGGSD